MIIKKKILTERPGLTLEKADALFGGRFSKWIAGEPVPERFRGRLESLFGKIDDEQPEPEAKTIEQEPKPSKRSKRRR